MRVTPADIKNKFFKKVLTGGYDRDEVNAFLMTIAGEWEKVLDDYKEQKIKLEIAEKEVKQLREIESSLFRTLKTAEDTSSQIVNQANQAADIKLKEVQMQAEIILQAARGKAQSLVDEAEIKARHIMESVLTELKTIEKDIRTLETQKDNLIVEMKGLVNDTLEKINRIDGRLSKVSFEEKIKDVKIYVDETTKPIELPPATPKLPEKSSLSTENTTLPSYNPKQPGIGSFFDEI
jgi:cell division initiation protein